MHAAGRRPAVESLDLEAAASRTTAPRCEFLQSEANPAVYAAGDAAATRLPLTPVASLFGLAIRHGLTAGDLKSSPTAASDIGAMLP